MYCIYGEENEKSGRKTQLMILYVIFLYVILGCVCPPVNGPTTINRPHNRLTGLTNHLIGLTC